MRMQHWATALMSLLGPLVVCSTTLAQPAPGYGTLPGGGFVDSGGYPDPYLTQTPMNPGVFQAQYGTPPATALPPGALPYPAVSPHLGPNIMQSQTFQQNGSWLNRIINRDRTYYGTAEYLHTNFSGPEGTRIGSRTAPLDPISNEPPVGINPWTVTVPPGGPISIIGSGSSSGEEGDVLPVWTGPGAWPEVIQRTALDSELLIITPNNLFPVQRTTSILNEALQSNGMRFRGGYFDRDGTGLQAEFWWGFNGSDSVQFGQDTYNGLPITQNLIAGFDVTGFPPVEIEAPQAAFLMSMRVGYLPLEDSSSIWNDSNFFPWPGTFNTGITGATQRYDLLWKVDTHVNAGGGNLNFFLGDVYRRSHASIKSFVGAKYMFIDDRFSFRGLDSGFGYAVDTTTFRPSGTIVGPLYPLFESILNSSVESQLAGPEFGLRGDLGEGGGFSMWWQGSFGLLVNHEQVRVQGRNIGNAYYYNSNDPIFAIGSISPAYDMFANDTSFNNQEEHTHVSPLVSLGINAQLGIFDTIPGLRKISLFDEAKLTLGYNLTYIGYVGSSADSIRWRGFPDFPTPQVDYRTFSMSQISVGLQFER